MGLPALKVSEVLRELEAEASPMFRVFGAVLDELGGMDFLVTWAEENPTDFMRFLVASAPGGQQRDTSPKLTLNIHPGLQPGPLDGVTIDND